MHRIHTARSTQSTAVNGSRVARHSSVLPPPSLHVLWLAQGGQGPGRVDAVAFPAQDEKDDEADGRVDGDG